MKINKSDWMLVREAEKQGMMAGITGIVERNRTPLADQLGSYARRQLTGFTGSYDAEEGETILEKLNELMKERGTNKPPLSFPYSEGSDVYLVPFSENLQIKVLIVDEYHGDGEFEKYVMIDFLLINEHTTEKEVDAFVTYAKEHLIV